MNDKIVGVTKTENIFYPETPPFNPDTEYPPVIYKYPLWVTEANECIEIGKATVELEKIPNEPSELIKAD